MANIALPIHPDNIHAELEHIEKVITKWRERISKGLPGIDIPTTDAEEKLDAFFREFTGELLFAAGKCQNMAVILSER